MSDKPTLGEVHASFAQKLNTLAKMRAKESRAAAAIHGERSRQLVAPKVPWPISLFFKQQFNAVRDAQASERAKEQALRGLASRFESDTRDDDLQKELTYTVAQANPALVRRIVESQERLVQVRLAIKALQGERLDIFQEQDVVVTEERIEIGERSYAAVISESLQRRFVVPANCIPIGRSLGRIRLDRRDEVSVYYFDDTLSLEAGEVQEYSPDGIEQNLADKFDSIITTAHKRDSFDENHITFSIVDYLKEQQKGFLIRYRDGWAHVTVKVDKLRDRREFNHGDLCLIVELNYKGELNAGVRYFEAKRRYIETMTYRAFDLEQIRRIHGNTAYSSLLAYDPSLPRGWSCSDISLECFMTPEFVKRDANTIVARSGRPFSERLVNQYFRLDDTMDCRADSVADAARYAKQRFDRIAHFKVSIDDDPKVAREISQQIGRELDHLIEHGRPLSRTRAPEERSRGLERGQ